MKQIHLLIFLLLVSNVHFFAQEVDSTKKSVLEKNYPFIIQDSPAKLYTMKQFSQDYLSSYRILSSVLDKSFSPIANYSIQSAAILLLLGALPHEEGHQSILTMKNIGSIVQPFTLSKRDGYVDGITDQTLENLRNTDFPDFIRLYTAGSESDYMMGNHEESLLTFGDETFRNLAAEYLLRKAFLVQYYLIGFFHYDVDGNEEQDELKRDAVGNDVYGTARHLYRPTMPFYRYTRFDSLTPQERKFVYKMGYRSLVNLVNPNIIGIPCFTISENVRMNFGMGHVLCPFGDFTDETFWLIYRKFKVQAYIREFENKNNWFMAGGVSLFEYPVTQKIETSISAHIWDQPKNFDFNETIGVMGGAIDFTGKYFFYTRSLSTLRRVSIDLGLIYKTKGFLPEEVYLSKHFGFRLGTTFSFE